MENYIRISNLNDFLFCPKSIYYHDLYGKYSQKTYHSTPQTKWTLNHANIDNQTYSSSKDILQWISVYSEKYNLVWKIDIYDKKQRKLVERKTKIKEIYEWYKLQLYAQYFCMKEMGYKVEKLQIHSLQDNKNYDIPIPDKKIVKDFEDFLQKYKKFDLLDTSFDQNSKKCEKCIYRELCDYYI